MWPKCLALRHYYGITIWGGRAPARTQLWGLVCGPIEFDLCILPTQFRASRQCCSCRDQFTSLCPCPWTSSPCLWTIKSLKIFKDFTFCKLSVTYDHVTSINSVTATVHEDTVKNVLYLLMSDITYWYMSASMPFFTVTQCMLLSSRKVLVLVPKDQFTSPCPCPWASSPWIQHCLGSSYRMTSKWKKSICIGHFISEIWLRLWLRVRCRWAFPL